MSRHDDTIAAPATPAGTGAIGVVRVSGPDTEALAVALAGRPPAERLAVHRDYRDATGRLIDDVVLTFFRGPRSYTGEDTLEISSHGSPFIIQTILEDLFARGCRPAEPGEFTQRAFLNGRMELSQAEAVMDLIHARSERALAAANQQLRGALGRRMEGLVDRLLATLARIEAYIDFPEEDLPPDDRATVLTEIDSLGHESSKLLATNHYGDMLRDGVKTVIVGATNVGKSSLLNRLVGKDRALVSCEPGTTRDFLEERVIVGPHCLRIIDTAGLNPTPAPLERLGMDKTMERIEEADLLLLVLDASQPSFAVPPELAGRLMVNNALVVLNKIDLLSDPKPGALPLPVGVSINKAVSVSALTGAGIEALTSAIVACADALTPADADEDVIAINARHARALSEARDALAQATSKLGESAPIELLASDLRAALAAFGEITGKVDNERMLDHLFATFCIGK